MMQNEVETFNVVRAKQCCGGIVVLNAPDCHLHAKALGTSVERFSFSDIQKFGWCQHRLYYTLPEWADLEDGVSVESLASQFGGNLTDELRDSLECIGVPLGTNLPGQVDVALFATAVRELFDIWIGVAKGDYAGGVTIGGNHTMRFIVTPQSGPEIRSHLSDTVRTVDLYRLGYALGEHLFQMSVWRAAMTSMGKSQLAFGVVEAQHLLERYQGTQLPEDFIVRSLHGFMSTLHGGFALWHMGMPATIIPYMLARYQCEDAAYAPLLKEMGTLLQDAFTFNGVLDSIAARMGGPLVWELAESVEERAESVARSAAGLLQVIVSQEKVSQSAPSAPVPIISA